jgi:hypothetical protein
MQVTFNEEQIKSLENWANELPTKYGMSFLNFLAKAVQDQNPPVAEEIKAED